MSSLHPKDYTAENVCFALGLRPAAEDPDFARGKEAIRFVFMPSFFFETAITFTRSGECAKVSCIVSQRKLENEPCVARLPVWRTEIVLQKLEFPAWVASFKEAEASLAKPKWFVLADGASVVVSCRSGNDFSQFMASTSVTDLVQQTCAEAVKIGRASANLPEVDDALRNIGSSLGLGWEAKPPAPAPTAKRLLILGTPACREDYFTMLSRAWALEAKSPSQPTPQEGA